MTVEAGESWTESTLAEFGRSLIENGPDAVIYADAEGVIRFWNMGAERVFGFTASEALGRSLDIIIPERLRQRHWDGFHQVMAGGQSKYGAKDLLSVPALTRSGETISIQFTVTAIHDAEGRITGIAAVLRDVTELHRELKRLRQQRS